ncbi:MAG: hypothetical protein EOP88_07610 [Verrucomicrobiaceae bacterium]|nr:MAG: hypothetical protein EOP88_07610 [Verrucomicrobiaceae bacterium]
MKIPLRKIKRGLTLIELSIAIMMGMAVGGMTLLLFNQQLTFLKLYKDQNFLTEEAPIISMYVSRLIGKADRFRLHSTVEKALAGTPEAVVSGDQPLPFPVVLLNYRQPDGVMRATILQFVPLENGGPALNYYVVPLTGALGAPQWAVTKIPKNVAFTMEQGVLRMTLTGPKDEIITYSGTMQQ